MDFLCTFPINCFSTSELDFGPSRIDNQEWVNVCHRKFRDLFNQRMQMTKKNCELAIRITRRAVEVLEIGYPMFEKARASRMFATNTTIGSCTRSRRSVLFRHLLGSIVGYGESQRSNEIGYIRQIKSTWRFELVAIISSSIEVKHRIIDLFKKLDPKKRTWINVIADNKENSSENSSIIVLDSDSDSDPDEVDVIKVLPPISQREHPVVEIEDDEGDDGSEKVERRYLRRR